MNRDSGDLEPDDADFSATRPDGFADVPGSFTKDRDCRSDGPGSLPPVRANSPQRTVAPLVTVFWLLWRRSVPRSPRWRQSLRPGADPFFVDEGDIDAARSLVAATSDAELFLYPGKEHLFADDSLAAYDQAAATLLTERVLSFLSSIN